MCLQTHFCSGFSPAQQAAKTTSSAKPLKIFTVHEVTNEKDKHVINVTNVKDKHTMNVTNDKVKRHRKQLKVNMTCEKTLKIFSTNGAGIVNGKLDSLKSEVKTVGATVVTIQETHCQRKGRI